MSFFPWLIVLLLMALIAELVVVGPRAIRAIRRGEGVRIEPASARLLLALVVIQVVLVIGWALLVRGRPF
ncbi:MAG TPA: hypothetical protein VNW68_01345 [Candidatus Limnocylindria bacterium]|nr:hypothetical protein [Candidatus Limnocylindria bacterium]